VIIDANRETGTQRYRGVSYTRPIDEAKRLIPIIDEADRLCGPGGLRRVGKEWVGRCPLPDHEDRSPSFTVNPEKNVFFCHGCVRGGDVVELARLAWGYDQRDAHVAAAMLLMEFGHDLPQRPESYFDKQARQGRTRDALEEAKVRRVQRRLYRWLFAPIIARFEDEDERLEEARIAWEDCGQIARLMVCRARGEMAA
jgi:DNA primase